MRRSVAAWVFAVLTAFAACGKKDESPAAVTVFAAASLTDAMTEIAERFTAESGVEVRLNVAGSTTLQQQIEHGAPADLFLSASPKQMDALATGGFILTDTRRDLLTNRIVVVSLVGNGIALTDPAGLVADRFKRIAVGDTESVPAGIYAKEALTSLGIWDAVHPKLAPGADVRAALAYVESGAAEAGIVYETDADVSEMIDVIAQFPETSHSPIVYPVAVIKNAANQSGAQSLLAFLESPAGREIFTQYGFTTLP